MKTIFNFHSQPDGGEIFPRAEQFLPVARVENFSTKKYSGEKTSNSGCFQGFFRNRAEIYPVAQPMLGGQLQ